jgi:hypothetical protein
MVLAPLQVAGQSRQARERELHAAIAAEPGEIRHYLALADYFSKQGQPEPADRVLRDGLAAVDPLSRPVFERRVLLFLEPFQPNRIGAIALEWLAVDGTNAVPVLIAAGHRLRQASARRADGTSASEQEIDQGLSTIDGALPANPDVAALYALRSSLLQGRASLVADVAKQVSAVKQAQADWQRAQELQVSSAGAPPVGGPLAPAVAAMTAMPPFGPPGAVRVGGRVRRPRLLKHVPPAGSRSPRFGERTRVIPLELVLDTQGRVVYVHAPESVDGYDTETADAVMQWEFEPTVVDGRAVPVILNTSVNARRQR